MEFVGAALILGFAGSLHCIGMCGPLVMAVHSAKSNGNWWYKKSLYHLGRISVYSIFGIIAGSIGQSFTAFGMQRWLSIAAGLAMMIFLAWPVGMKSIKSKPLQIVGWLKTKFSSLIQRQSTLSHLALGVLNGLLPCGLVYVAMAATIALSGIWKSALFMALFGLATTPALFAAGSILKIMSQKLRVKSYRAVQVSLIAISMLLIVRGANLGIPYLSPKMSAESKKIDCCHKP
jgi:sulfite exporter TauE/SafE